MPEDTSITDPTTEEEELNISEEVKEQFPELIELIKGSQSMNHEERQYWVDVLPIMTEDQISNLRGILENEQKQMEEADREYEEGVQEEARIFINKFDQYKYKEKKKARVKVEKRHEMEEAEREKALLEEISKM